MKAKNCGNCKDESCVFQGDWGSSGCDFWLNESQQTKTGKQE